MTANTFKPLTTFVLFFGCISLLFIASNCDDHDCGSVNECSGGVNFDPHCIGYSSCQDSIGIGINSDVDCDGSHSCLNSMQLYAQGDYDVECTGANSCSNCSNIRSVYGQIECEGMISCMDSIIESFDCSNKGDNEVECFGAESCINSKIFAFSKVYGSGAHSLRKTDIYSSNTNDDKTLYVRYDGYLAGMGSNVICLNGDSCEISCRGNGCEGVTFMCDDSISECIIDCHYSQDLCPILVSNETEFSFLRDDRSKGRPHGISDDKEDSRQEGRGDGRQDDRPDSGHGYDGRPGDKPNSKELVSRIEEYCSNSDDMNSIVICDNEDECNNAIFDSSDISNASSILTICCRGEESCDEITVLSISDEIDSNVACMGEESCQHMIYSGNYELELKETGAMYNRDIINERGYVTCGGYKSCDASIIENVDSVYCAGYQACFGSDIKNVDKLVVSSYKGCDECCINGVSEITVTGSNGIDSATVASHGIGEMRINLMSDEAGENSTIICDENDICNINCIVANSCDDMTFVCFGDCIFECDPNNGVECPNASNINGNYTIEIVSSM